MLTLLSTRRRHPGRLFHKAEPQIFDLLKLTHSEAECRANFLSIKHKLHKWNVRVEKNGIRFLSPVHYGEGAILRRKAQAAVLTYRLVRRERIRVFREYTDRLPTKNSFLRRAA